MNNIRQVYLIYAAEQDGEHWREFNYNHELAFDHGKCAYWLFYRYLNGSSDATDNYACYLDVKEALPGVDMNDIWIY